MLSINKYKENFFITRLKPILKQAIHKLYVKALSNFSGLIATRYIQYERNVANNELC